MLPGVDWDRRTEKGTSAKHRHAKFGRQGGKYEKTVLMQWFSGSSENPKLPK